MLFKICPKQTPELRMIFHSNASDFLYIQVPGGNSFPLEGFGEALIYFNLGRKRFFIVCAETRTFSLPPTIHLPSSSPSVSPWSPKGTEFGTRKKKKKKFFSNEIINFKFITTSCSLWLMIIRAEASLLGSSSTSVRFLHVNIYRV